MCAALIAVHFHNQASLITALNAAYISYRTSISLHGASTQKTIAHSTGRSSKQSLPRRDRERLQCAAHSINCLSSPCAKSWFPSIFYILLKKNPEPVRPLVIAWWAAKMPGLWDRWNSETGPLLALHGTVWEGWRAVEQCYGNIISVFFCWFYISPSSQYLHAFTDEAEHQWVVLKR